MNLDAITDYYVLDEVRARWELPPGSMAIHRAVMKDVLKVCMWLNGPFQPAQLSDGGKLVPMTNEDGSPAVGEINAWCYMLGARQIDAFELEYSYALDCSGDVPRYWLLQEPCLLSRVLTEGVVMVHDLYTAETVVGPPGAEAWQARSAATKEKASMLRLISALAADAYWYDPRRKDCHAVESLQAETTRQAGKPMHAQTIVKYLDMAISDFPPEYMKLPPKPIDSLKKASNEVIAR
jgi:hypothetical protein